MKEYQPVTVEQAKQAAKGSEIDAMKCSIAKWEYYANVDRETFEQAYCNGDIESPDSEMDFALCLRSGTHLFDSCALCPLPRIAELCYYSIIGKTGKLFREWEEFVDSDVLRERLWEIFQRHAKAVVDYLKDCLEKLENEP